MVCKGGEWEGIEHTGGGGSSGFGGNERHRVLRDSKSVYGEEVQSIKHSEGTYVSINLYRKGDK